MNEKTKEKIALSLLKEHLACVNKLTFEVSGDSSMRPFLQKGDRVTVKKISARDLTLGDIVICQARDCFYIHRFLYKSNPNILITKADNYIYLDRPLPEENLIGKAIVIRRNNKEVLLEAGPWNNLNFIMGALALFQVKIYKLLRSVKRLLYKDKPVPFAEALKIFLNLPLRVIVSALQLFSA